MYYLIFNIFNAFLITLSFFKIFPDSKSFTIFFLTHNLLAKSCCVIFKLTLASKIFTN